MRTAPLATLHIYSAGSPSPKISSLEANRIWLPIASSAPKLPRTGARRGIAFVSDRTGRQEVFISDELGKNPKKLSDVDCDKLSLTTFV